MVLPATENPFCWAHLSWCSLRKTWAFRFVQNFVQNLQDFFASVHISSIFACICIWKGSWGGGVRFRVRPGLRPNPFLRKWNWSLSSWATASCLTSRVLHICAWAACEIKSRSIPISHICTQRYFCYCLYSLCLFSGNYLLISLFHLTASVSFP